MKTLRYILITAILSFIFVTIANADGVEGKPKKTFNTTFDIIKNHPDLVLAIYKQVDPSFLEVVEDLYVVKVIYNGASFRILGSRQDWVKFFKVRVIPPQERKLTKKIY